MLSGLIAQLDAFDYLSSSYQLLRNFNRFFFCEDFCIVSNGQLHFESSISEFECLVSNTTSENSCFVRMITGLTKSVSLRLLFFVYW